MDADSLGPICRIFLEEAIEVLLSDAHLEKQGLAGFQ